MPPIALRANQLAKELSALNDDDADGLRALHDSPVLRAAHEEFLPVAKRRQRGQIEPDRAMAEAKLIDASTLEDIISWLKPKERMVILHDRALISLLVSLPSVHKAE